MDRHHLRRPGNQRNPADPGGRPPRRAARRGPAPQGRALHPGALAAAGTGPLHRPHQCRQRAGLLPDAGAGLRPGPRQLAPLGAAPARPLHLGRQRVRRPPGLDRAQGRQQPHPGGAGIGSGSDGCSRRGHRDHGAGRSVPAVARRFLRVRHHGAALRLPVADHAAALVRFRHGDRHAHPAPGAGGAVRPRQRALPDAAAVRPRARRRGGADHPADAQRHGRGRHGAAAALRLRLLRPRHRGRLLHAHPEPGGPGLDPRRRPRARRLGKRLGLVPGRARPGQAQQLHRLRGLRRTPGRARLRRPRRHRGARGVGRWAADGSGRQPGAAAVRGDRGAGAVRRHAQHHVGHQPAADPAGMAGMGQPPRGRGRLPADCRVFPL